MTPRSFLYLGLMTLGCSSSRIPDEGPVSWNKFQSLLPNVVCDRVLECDCPMDKRGGTDRHHCKSSVRLYLEDLSLNDDEGTRFDGDLAWECLHAAENADCENAAWAPICDRVMQPLFEPGESCRRDWQCKGVWEQQAYCDDSSTCTSGRRDFTRQLGDTCRYTQAPTGIATGTDYPAGTTPPGPGVCLLSEGLRCEQGECVPVAQEGEPCETLFDCAQGFYCADGTCAAHLQLGQECPEDFTMACGFENYCNQARVCARLRADGEECVFGTDCTHHNCSPSGTCLPSGQETVCEHFSGIEIGD